MKWRFVGSRARGPCYLLLGLVCASAGAQEAIKLDVLPTEGRAVAVVKTSAAGRWLVFDRELLPVAGHSWRLEAGGSVVVWEGPPGAVYGVIFIPDDNKQPIGSEQVRLAGAAPDPTPDPPGPGPPDPDEPPAWCVVIEERGERTVQTSALVNSTELANYLQTAGLKRWFKDRDLKDGQTDQSHPLMAQFLEYLTAKQIPLPALLLTSETGRVLYAGRLPANVAELAAIVDQYSKPP